MSSYFIAGSSSAASSPIASESPGVPIASEKPDSRMNIEPSSFDAASTCQVRLNDAHLGGFVEEQRRNTSHQEEEEDSEESDNLEDEVWIKKGEPVVRNHKTQEKPLAHGVSSSVDKESQKNTEATLDHHIHISPDTSPYMEAVFSMVRKINGKQPDDPMVK